MKKPILFFIFLLAISLIAIIPLPHLAKAQVNQQTSITLDPLTVNATKLNQTFTLSIDVSNVQNLWGWIATLTYDSEYLKFESSSEGKFLTNQVDSTMYVATKPTYYKDPYSNLLKTLQQIRVQDAVSSTSGGEEQSATGSGVLATLTFEAIKQTTSTSIALNVTNLEGPNPSSATTGTAHPQINLASSGSTAIVTLIIPGAPTANAGQEQSVSAGTAVTLDGSSSVSSGSNTSYTWAFTDGTPKNLTGKVVNYTFNNPGNYTVALTVTDSLGTSNSTVLIHVFGDSMVATSTPPATQQTTNCSTPTPTATYTADTTPTPQQDTGSFTLPTALMGILVFVTICTFAGSAFWLRKQT